MADTSFTPPYLPPGHHQHEDSDQHRHAAHLKHEEESRASGPSVKLVCIIFGSIFGMLMIALLLRLIFDRIRSRERSQTAGVHVNTIGGSRRDSNPFSSDPRTPDFFNQDSNPERQEFSTSIKEQVLVQPWTQAHKRISSLGKGYGRLYDPNQPARISMSREDFDYVRESHDIALTLMDDQRVESERNEENTENPGSPSQISQINPNPPSYLNSQKSVNYT